MTTYNLSCFAGVGQQFFDNNGNVLSGGLIYTYLAGTTTPAATYTDSTGNTAHPNPIVLDSAGKVPSGGEIWVAQGVLFKYVIKTSEGVLLNTYDNVPSQVGSEAITSTILNPLMFGAVGDGVTNDTTALNAMFAAAVGRTIDGLGKTYKVVPDVEIDPYATAGVGYGAGKKWFCVTNCTRLQNMSFIGSVSFGNSFFGKWLSVGSVTITGDCRISSWYVDYQGLNITGTTWLGGDLPPTANFFGFYYNTFENCVLNNVICDQRYGPVNLNTFIECRFDTWWVKNTGYVGWTAGSYPYQSFHMNQFLSCEWFSTTGITAPDTYSYVAVIGDSLGNGVTSGGVNRVIGAYNESTIRGFYGDSWQIENIHFSGELDSKNGGGQIAYNIPFMGEPAPQAGEARVAPAVYPVGNIATGGDWSVVDSNGLPICFDLSNITATVVSDSTEPTGLGRCANLASVAAFATVTINGSVPQNANNHTACSYAIIYKVVSGEPTIEAPEPGTGTLIYGATTCTRLSNDWVLAYGVCDGKVRFTSATNFTIRISAMSICRGAGVISPVTNQPGGLPMLRMNGGPSQVQQAIYSGGYNNSQTKNYATAAGAVSFYSIDFGAFTGKSANVRVMAGLSSSSGGTRMYYRESVVKETGSGTLSETNLHNITDVNGSLTFDLTGAVLTVKLATSSSSTEDCRVAVEVLGTGFSGTNITKL